MGGEESTGQGWGKNSEDSKYKWDKKKQNDV